MLNFFLRVREEFKNISIRVKGKGELNEINKGRKVCYLPIKVSVVLLNEDRCKTRTFQSEKLLSSTIDKSQYAR